MGRGAWGVGHGTEMGTVPFSGGIVEQGPVSVSEASRCRGDLRGVQSDVRGILLRVASLEDTLVGKISPLVRSRPAADQAPQGSHGYCATGGSASPALGPSTRPRSGRRSNLHRGRRPRPASGVPSGAGRRDRSFGLLPTAHRRAGPRDVSQHLISFDNGESLA
jgi:hypothetical protein